MTGKNALNFSTRSSHAAHTRTLISDDGNGDNENGDGGAFFSYVRAKRFFSLLAELCVASLPRLGDASRA